jgi:spore coat polysaccharide biosynthesis predicted glycosyltransferase SpsG
MAAMVEIICDANPQIGFGHLRRCQTLSQQLNLDGIDTKLRCLSDHAQRFLAHEVRRNDNVVLTVLDVPFAPQGLLDNVREKSSLVVGLDWFALEQVDVNIVIFEHSVARAIKAVHVGWDFVMIRPEIAGQALSGQPTDSQHVLVFLGGGDLLSQSETAAQLLAQSGLKVTLVLGPLVQSRKVDPLHQDFEVRVNPSELPEMLAQCDWTVTNGGACMFESLYLGKPAYVLPQTEAEKRVSFSIQALGALLGVGSSGLRPFDLNTLQPVAERGRGLIDGRGAQRVSRILQELMN